MTNMGHMTNSQFAVCLEPSTHDKSLSLSCATLPANDKLMTTGLRFDVRCVRASAIAFVMSLGLGTRQNSSMPCALAWHTTNSVIWFWSFCRVPEGNTRRQHTAK